MTSANNYPVKLNLSQKILGFLLVCLTVNACKIYSFKDVSIPPEVKTIRLGFIENRARYVDPQLSPQLTDKLKQKISNQTKLIQIQGENADYDVSAYVSEYSVSTVGVSNQSAS